MPLQWNVLVQSARRVRFPEQMMEYKYTPERENYAIYAAGGVFYAAPGHSAFPVRLAVETFRRCLHWRSRAGASGPVAVYDPCCGGAYHLATLAWFDWASIERIYASDVDADALRVAARNLSLLTPAGMDRRIVELTHLYEEYGKESHALALQHAAALQERLSQLVQEHTIETGLFCADATDREAIAAGLAGAKAGVVLTDIPYGQVSHWHGGTAAVTQGTEPVGALLESLLPVLADGAVVAVAAGKGDKIRHEAYRRLERFTVGKRQVALLQPVSA